MSGQVGDGGPGPVLCVAALCRAADSLVLVRRGSGRADGSWDLPRAAVTGGETAAEAVVRAAEHEIGVTAVCGPFAGWSELADVEDPVVTLYFDAIPIDAGTIGADPSEGTAPGPPGPAGLEVRAVPLWEVTELRLFPGLAEFLADIGLIDLLI